MSPNVRNIIFIGDVHKDWAVIERGIFALPRPPEAVVLLGDLQCESALDDHAAPLLDRGIAVHWIFGNHDNDGGPDMWANMADPARNPRTAPGALHAKVQTIAGLRIAGLGGTFRHRIWGPPGLPPPACARRTPRRSTVPRPAMAAGATERPASFPLHLRHLARRRRGPRSPTGRYSRHP